MACHKSDVTYTAVDPIGPLYRRWVLVSSQDGYITFLAGGIILYGKDGTDGACCLPRVFVRQDSLLNFTNVPPRTIPAFVNTADCSAVRCAWHGDSWKIISLTADQLILQTPYSKQTYRAD